MKTNKIDFNLYMEYMYKLLELLENEEEKKKYISKFEEIKELSNKLEVTVKEKNNSNEENDITTDYNIAIMKNIELLLLDIYNKVTENIDCVEIEKSIIKNQKDLMELVSISNFVGILDECQFEQFMNKYESIKQNNKYLERLLIKEKEIASIFKSMKLENCKILANVPLSRANLYENILSLMKLYNSENILNIYMNLCREKDYHNFMIERLNKAAQQNIVKQEIDESVTSSIQKKYDKEFLENVTNVIKENVKKYVSQK